MEGVIVNGNQHHHDLGGPRPLIGLSAYRERAVWGVWDTQTDLLNSLYARSVEAAGGIAVLLPPQGEEAAEVVRRLDGLVITGGSDVEPARYGHPAHPRTQRPRQERDSWELALLDRAAELAIPTLGICRGMQVMAVHRGGSLEQHVPDAVGHEGHSPGGDTFGDIGVQTCPGTRLRMLVGDSGLVACHHHQSVRDHPGFVPAAVADDGTVEAIEWPGERFLVGVQWHPETRSDAGLFAGLVAAATTPDL